MTPSDPTTGPETPAEGEALNELTDFLDAAAAIIGADWGLEITVASECAWSAEVRITPYPGENRSDRSLVTLAVGGSDPTEVAIRAVKDALALVSEAKLKPRPKRERGAA